jgi:ribosomal protein S18 acetylase RimI-like enzyme
MIRLAKQEDADAIARMWEDLVRYHHIMDSDLPDSAPNGGKVYAHRITDRLNDTHTRVLVAEEDGKVVGYVLGVIVDLVPEMFVQEDGGFLADIYVDEAYRGKGIGRALVEALRVWFGECGVRYFEWYVASHNENARAFWRAVGGRDMMIRMRTNIIAEEKGESEKGKVE